jgi:hypothetical protein
MISRLAQPTLRKLWRQFLAVALLGPRQVGKTTLAHSLAEELGEKVLYLDLELPSDRAKLTEPELYLAQQEERLVSLGNPTPSKGFYIGSEDIHATRQIVLYPGDERFKIDAKRRSLHLPGTSLLGKPSSWIQNRPHMPCIFDNIDQQFLPSLKGVVSPNRRNFIQHLKSTLYCKFTHARMASRSIGCCLSRNA